MVPNDPMIAARRANAGTFALLVACQDRCHLQSEESQRPRLIEREPDWRLRAVGQRLVLGEAGEGNDATVLGSKPTPPMWRRDVAVIGDARVRVPAFQREGRGWHSPTRHRQLTPFRLRGRCRRRHGEVRDVTPISFHKGTAGVFSSMSHGRSKGQGLLRAGIANQREAAVFNSDRARIFTRTLAGLAALFTISPVAGLRTSVPALRAGTLRKFTFSRPGRVNSPMPRGCTDPSNTLSRLAKTPTAVLRGISFCSAIRLISADWVKVSLTGRRGAASGLLNFDLLAFALAKSVSLSWVE
jgi:hypothetical protein